MAIKYLMKCPICKKATAIEPTWATSNDGIGVCPTCRSILDLDEYGYIDIYRKGNVIGEGDGFTIKVDKEVYGSIKNKERLRVIVPYGTHTLSSATILGGEDAGISVTLNSSQKILYVNGYVTAKIEFGYIGPQANKFKFETVDASAREVSEPLPVKKVNQSSGMLVNASIGEKVENNLNGFGPMVVYKVKCPSCAQAVNTTVSGKCPICDTTINWDNYGFLDIHRITKMKVGINVAGDIHIDDSYMGHIADKEMYRLAIPYGNHRIKFFNNETVFNVSLSPSDRIKYAEIYMTMGWSSPHIHFDEASEVAMPVRGALPPKSSVAQQPATQAQVVSPQPVAPAQPVTPVSVQPQPGTMQIEARTIFCTKCGNKLIVPVTNTQSKTICNKCDSIVIYNP